MVENLELHDGQEGIKAFLEKRKPTWTNTTDCLQLVISFAPEISTEIACYFNPKNTTLKSTAQLLSLKWPRFSQGIVQRLETIRNTLYGTINSTCQLLSCHFGWSRFKIPTTFTDSKQLAIRNQDSGSRSKITSLYNCPVNHLQSGKFEHWKLRIVSFSRFRSLVFRSVLLDLSAHC